MNKFLLALVIASMFYLTGCSESETKTSVSKHPDAEEVLRLDENADIFQWEGKIYQTDIDWVNELELTKEELVGEITKSFTNDESTSFSDGMANKLPIGAKIYSTKENGILIVEYNGEEEYYLALVEG